jgi:protein-L-isoaspartate(D-aspartate) O-methyltransferase
MDIELARFNMIEQQVRPWDVLDSAVLEVMQTVPRELFAPKQHKNLAFADIEIPLDHDQVMMSPKVEGRMLQALNISKTDQVLEIGTGSGYISACLAALSRQVTSIDIHADFITSTKQKVAKLKTNRIEFINGDIFKKAHSLGTYDVILATGSIPEHSLELAKLLRPGGRLFVIIGEHPIMTASLITCFAQGEYRTDTLFETCIPSLINTDKAPVFTL